VSPNQPLIPARNLETMIQKWIEARGGRWQDLDEWKDREECLTTSLDSRDS